MATAVLAVAAVLVVLLAVGSIYQAIEVRRSALLYAPPGRMVDVAGQHLHVICAGNGAPGVLFESGIAASSLSWSVVLPGVAEFTRACAYDRAGLGWSEPARAPRTVLRMIDEMAGVAASAAPDAPLVVVGHSFGALLACAYASQCPANIAGLVLLDPPSDWHHMTRERARLLRGAIQLSRIGGVLARVGVVRGCLALLTGGAPGVPRNFVRVFGPTAARTVERLVGEVRKLPADVHPVVQALWCQPKCYRAMAEHLAALAPTVALVGGTTSLPDVPLIVISAGDQRPDTIARHRELAQLSSQSRHLVASKSGHWIQFDEPDLVVAAIREVVDRVRQTHAA